MNPPTGHPSSYSIRRILGMLLIAIMLAQPVLAVIPAAGACQDGCCCCPARDGESLFRPFSISAVLPDCCGSDGTTAACRMASAQPADTPPALIRNAAHAPFDAGQACPSALHAAIRTDAAPTLAWWFDGPPPPRTERPYLINCRLIC